MAPRGKVLIIGPGFIGCSILELLVGEHYQVTALVRRKVHAVQIAAMGASPVLLMDGGNMDLDRNKAIITEQTIKHDIIIYTASAHDLSSVQAVLDGLQKRCADNKKQGSRPIFIHTSGMAVWDDAAEGAYRGGGIHYDNVRSDVDDSVSDLAPHRRVDLAILAMQRKLIGKAKMAIIMPPVVYGRNLRNDRMSMAIPTLVRFALKHGWAGHVGGGLSVASNVHVRDLARGYRLLLRYLEHTSALCPEILGNPYYFCEATGDREPSWKDVADVMGTSLHNAGKIADPVSRTIEPELYGDLFGEEHTGAMLGLNSRSRAVRLREMGWKPVEKGWRESLVQDELPVILKERGLRRFRGYEKAAAGNNIQQFGVSMA